MPDDPVREYLRRIGRKGGKKGGPARMRQLTAEERAALGRQGGKASGAARRAKAKRRQTKAASHRTIPGE